MNILLTSVGRRNYLVAYFQEALHGRGHIFAANTTSDASGAIAADRTFLVPSANDPSYVEALLQICVEHKVKAVLSLHDWEAPFLAASADRFRDHNIVLIMSRPEIIALCLDKYKTYQFALERGFAAPLTTTNIADARQALRDGRMTFPVVIKPRRGQGSIGLEIVEEDWELDTCHRRSLRNCARIPSNDTLSQDGDEAMLIQQFLHGVEYGLDVVNDLAGRFACCLVKRKLAMRAGETDSAETVRSDVLEAYGRTLGHLLGHIGVLDVDVILVGETPYLLELNPRFGGHYPFAHAAGANIPAAIIAWLSGEPVQEEWLRVRPGVRSIKGITLESISPSWTNNSSRLESPTSQESGTLPSSPSATQKVSEVRTRGTVPKAMPGYGHRVYAESLADFGVPRELTHADGWILQRQTPVLGLQDVMGCYPLFCCRDWCQLGGDLNQLQDSAVCLSLVADPFGNHTPDLLKSLFEVVQPYKRHFVADLSLPLEQFTSARHRSYGRKALRRVSVDICSNPLAHLDEWVALYQHLIERHAITGMRRFSRETFARQLSVPGMVMFRAAEGNEPLSLDLWYVQGEVAHAHLAATSPRGYELQVSYGLKLFILQYLAGRVRWANLGAVPGVEADKDSGLSVFKRGWSSDIRIAFFCGKIFNADAYRELVRATRSEGSNFLPAYRKGEFS